MVSIQVFNYNLNEILKQSLFCEDISTVVIFWHGDVKW